MAKSAVLHWLAILPLTGLLGCLGQPETSRELDEVDSEDVENPTLTLSHLLGVVDIDESMLQPGPEFDVAREGGQLVARHPQMPLQFHFSDGDLSIGSSHTAEWQTTVTFTGLGRSGEAVNEAALLDERFEGNSIILQRASQLTEWYLHGPRGLEQGFTLGDAPQDRDGDLMLVLEVSGELAPELSVDEQTVVFRDATGEARLRYGGLSVVDQNGLDLPARFVVEEQLIRILIDDRDALYPVVVDPLFYEGKNTFTVDEDDRYGWAVATDGEMLLSGAPYDMWRDGSGATYWFNRLASSWDYYRKGAVWTSAEWEPAEYGYSVTVESGRSAVGAPDAIWGGVESGTVFTYTHSATEFEREQRLTPDDGDDGDQFGYSVALDYPYLVIGAPGDDDLGTNAGAIYVFWHTGGAWTQLVKRTASDGGAFDRFGAAVDISGDLIVVGAPGYDGAETNMGALYSFSRTAIIWSEDSDRPEPPTVVENSGFGEALALDGRRLLAGLPRAFDGTSDVGAAALYSRNSFTGNWSTLEEFNPEPAVFNSRFGSAVALDGDYAAIGAARRMSGGTSSGAVHVFVDDDVEGWVEADFIIPPDPHSNQRFGQALSMSSGLLVVGAPNDNEAGTDAGALPSTSTSPTVRPARATSTARADTVSMEYVAILPVVAVPTTVKPVARLPEASKTASAVRSQRPRQQRWFVAQLQEAVTSPRPATRPRPLARRTWSGRPA